MEKEIFTRKAVLVGKSSENYREKRFSRAEKENFGGSKNFKHFSNTFS